MMPATHTVMAVTLASGAAECRYHASLLVVDKHRLDYEQVVVERDDSVDQRDEHQHIESRSARFGGGCEDEELAEEARKRRDTGQREHGEHHCERQLGIGRIQVVVAVHIYLAGLVLDSLDYTEGGEVAEDIHKDIVHQRAETLGSGGHHAEHDIAGLGYRREREEALQILPGGERRGYLL